jgi:hypothetical protein
MSVGADGGARRVREGGSLQHPAFHLGPAQSVREIRAVGIRLGAQHNHARHLILTLAIPSASARWPVDSGHGARKVLSAVSHGGW